MKKENALISQESTEVVLRKATNIMKRTNKILKNSKKELLDNPEIVVIDGLMYQNQPFTQSYTWEEAKEYAKNLRLGGYDDWRLPTQKELRKLCNITVPIFAYYDEEDIAKRVKWFDKHKNKRLKNSRGEEYFINKAFLENMHHKILFWILDEYKYGNDFSCVVDFNSAEDRFDDNYSNTNYVLCVR